VELNGKCAGFVLVRRIQTDEENYFSIAEFFIMKNYRRLGLGKRVAKEIFDLHIGQWEVFQIEKNKPAQFFWKKTINEYTNGDFQERVEAGKTIQKFASSN
jgi:predicted acetyltransferase